ARLCGAVDAVLGAIGVTQPPAGQTSFERTEAVVREALGDAAFAAARSLGRALSPEQILAEADRGLVPASAPSDQPDPARPFDGVDLTSRDRDLLRLLAAGQTDQQIADALFIARRTVTTRVGNILAKLGAANRTEAVAYAVRQGLA